MGEEIGQLVFEKEDYARFHSALQTETDRLQSWQADGTLSDAGFSWGLELEAWLLDHNNFPNPINEVLLNKIANTEVVPELSRFNIEFNAPPRDISGDCFSAARAHLQKLWDECNRVAHSLDTQLAMIGTVPTIRNTDLSLENISPLKRYYALNNEILRQRNGRPIRVHIEGIDTLDITHEDVMLEAAATSFQLHLKTPVSKAHEYYNASVWLAAPLLAAAANSPLLFEHELWSETRIPLFEQSIAGFSGWHSENARVCFGNEYLRNSILECFEENLERYPILLPVLFDEPAQAMRHLSLHNGTIWRWNRPLFGRDAHGHPHIRLENRILPAGPTIIDMMANSALYLGLVHDAVLNARSVPCSFDEARKNFYDCARYGLEASVSFENQKLPVDKYLLDTLLPRARTGLQAFAIAQEDIDQYLTIIRLRVESKQTGANWQSRAWKLGKTDSHELMAAYSEHQRSGNPVHEWPSLP